MFWEAYDALIKEKWQNLFNKITQVRVNVSNNVKFPLTSVNIWGFNHTNVAIGFF